jgi:hypothetical protein
MERLRFVWLKTKSSMSSLSTNTCKVSFKMEIYLSRWLNFGTLVLTSLIFCSFHGRASVEKQLLGTETVYAMRSKGVKSIICGLSANDVEDQFLNSGANYFMYKPFPCKKVKITTQCESRMFLSIPQNGKSYFIILMYDSFLFVCRHATLQDALRDELLQLLDSQKENQEKAPQP